MGIINTEITLVNPIDTYLARRGEKKADEVRKVTVEAIVDSGASRLVINEEIQEQLGVLPVDSAPVRLADGSLHRLPITEPISIHFKNRTTIGHAIVAPRGSRVLLGAIPLQDMDVVLNMKEEKLEVNPESPDEQLVLLY